MNINEYDNLINQIKSNQFNDDHVMQIIKDNIMSIFDYLCENGHLDVAKWLYKLYKSVNTKIDIHALNVAFIVSCFKGHLDAAKWLYKVSKKDGNTIDIHYYDENAFKASCDNNHLDVAKWLYELSMTDDNKKINIHAEYEYAFRWSCLYGHIDLAKWLCTICHDYRIIQDDHKLIPCMLEEKNITILIENDESVQEIVRLYNTEDKSYNEICMYD